MPCTVFYNKSYIYANEVDLSLFIGLMVRIIDRECEHSWYQKARARWAHDVICSGSNLLDLSMDELISSPEDLDRMKDMLSRLQAEIRSYGEFLPREEASSLVPATMWYNKDVSTARLCAEVERIAALLPEE